MKKVHLALIALVFSANAFAQNHLHLYGNGWNLSIGNEYQYVYPPHQLIQLPLIIYQQPPIPYQQQRYLVKVCGPVYQTMTIYGVSYQQNCWNEWKYVYQ